VRDGREKVSEMARIEGEIVIARPVDEVFGYAAGQRDEPDDNRRREQAAWASMKRQLESGGLAAAAHSRHE
jgi:hypothetical protein